MNHKLMGRKKGNETNHFPFKNTILNYFAVFAAAFAALSLAFLISDAIA